jgi:hypothetical protein
MNNYQFRIFPMSFSSNGTSFLRRKMEGEVVGSSSTRCMCNLPINK